MKLVLFDVDGTLIRSGSVRFDYWKAVAKKHFGIDAKREDAYMGGATDRQILAELLELKGVKNPEKDKRFHDALRDLGRIVRKRIEECSIEKIHNAERLIIALKDEGPLVGLLTGNTPSKARVKLEKVGLWRYFKVGAFGHESRIRSELVPIAIKDAKKKTGISFDKKKVYVIGDTVRDVRCAREVGVKSIAVATGNESYNDLREESPDFLFRDFSNIEKIIAAIMK